MEIMTTEFKTENFAFSPLLSDQEDEENTGLDPKEGGEEDLDGDAEERDGEGEASGFGDPGSEPEV